MGSNHAWPSVPLEELVESDSTITYGVVKPGDEDPTGVAFIRGGDIANCRILTDQLRTITPAVSTQYRRTLLRGGELVVSLVGNPGQVALVPESLAGANIARQVGLVRLNDAVDPRFVLYFLASPAGQAALGAQSLGSVQQVINLRDLKTVEVPVPPRPEQEAIAAVLGALDDKIEQNRRTGRALEGLARATFKAWFADFEPVKAKAAGQMSFPGMPPAAFAALPDRLTDSPLGPVPQGWVVTNIGKVAQRVAMGPFGSDIKTDNFVSDGVPVIRGGNLTKGFVDRDFVFLTEAKADQLANANAFPGDIVITHRGTLGQIGLIPDRSRYPRYVVSQSQMLIRPNAAVLPSHFLYLFLTSSAGQHELLANRSQTGVPAISRPTTSVKAISLILPQRSVIDAFEGIVTMLFNAQVAAKVESAKLAALRDYLLPRLLSGRVRVSNVELPTNEAI